MDRLKAFFSRALMWIRESGRRIAGRPASWWLPLIAGIVPVCIALSYTCQLQRADQWLVAAEPFLAWQSGEADYWQVVHEQVNDSRMDTAKVVHLLLARFTGWNQRLEALLCVLTGIAIAALLIWLFRRRPPGDSRSAFFLATLCTLLWLTPDQSMNWMWGVLLGYMLVVLFILAVIVIFQTRISLPIRTTLASVFAFLACHSFITGWLAWGVILTLLLWEGWNRGFLRKSLAASTGIWAGFLAVTMVVYFSGFEMKAGESASGSREPGDLVWFFLSNLGAPLSKLLPGEHDFQLALMVKAAPWIGGAGLALLAGLGAAGLFRGHWKGRGEIVFPYLLIAGWGLINSAAITFARTGMLISDPFQYRYLAHTLWFHFALLALLFLARGTIWKGIRRGWIVVVIAGYLGGFDHGLGQCRRDFDRDRITTAVGALRHVAPDPHILYAVGGIDVIDRIDSLETAGCLNVPSIRTELVDESNLADEKSIRGGLREAKLENGKPMIRGWALRRDNRDMADAIVISWQTSGEPERWLGVAQRRSRSPKNSQKHDSIAQDDRLGWRYEYGSGTQYGANPGPEVPLAPKPLPAGKIVLRAYVYDLETGEFARIPGEMEVALTEPLPAN